MTRTLAPGLGLVLALAACAELQNGQARQGAAGTCPAAEHQDWVGQSLDVRSSAALPGEHPPAACRAPRRRWTTARTGLNVEVDKADKVTKVYCG